MAGRFESPAQAFAWADAFLNFERQTPGREAYGLERMAALLEAFGHPELAVPVIHVAGSKGKGTLVHWLSAALAEAGCRVGRYTSPHLRDWRERIATPDGFFPDEAYLAAFEDIADFIERLPEKADWRHGQPTAFEILTLAAWLMFRSAGLDWAVVETGLGGLLDATNLGAPKLCILTRLELEHTDILGDTLEEIAAQKAGIFKPGALLAARWPDEPAASVAAVIEGAAERAGGRMVWVQDDPDVPNRPLLFTALRLLGEAKLLALPSDSANRAALCTRAIARASIPGRLEWHARGGEAPRILVDVAHTPNSVARALAVFEPRPGDLLLFGSVSGKRHDDMAEILASGFGRILVTTPGTTRKSEPASVYAAFAALTPAARYEPDTRAAWDEAALVLAREPESRVLVCGSFYLAGAVLPWIEAAGFAPIKPEVPPCP